MHTSLFRHFLHPNRYKPCNASLAILSEPSHILYGRFCARLASRPRNGLWISITANSMNNKGNQGNTSGMTAKELRREAIRANLLTKSVVRHWVRRRIKTALREELKGRGWGFDGLPSEKLKTGRGNRVGGGSMEVLKGTVEIVANKEAIRAEYGELKTDIGKLVEQMVKKMKVVDGSDAERMKETGYR